MLITAVALLACGPKAQIPPRPQELRTLPDSIADGSVGTDLARSLAPVLYLQRDETFPLERVVAVLHPSRPIIAYHLLWRDDAHGSWIPFTVPTDQEIVWVGYDETGAPTDLWAFWHGKVLHADWRRRGPAVVNVQWGKHGSLPRGIVESDLPRSGRLSTFYAFSLLGFWDMWLGKLTRPGPGCFCRGFDRYRDFSRPLVLGERIDMVVRTESPNTVLATVFGKPFSKKRPWP